MPMQSPELSTRLAQAGQPRRNASEPLLVGIDLGTTTCKAVVVSAGGAELAHGAVPTPWRAVPSGAETDPRVLVDAALGAAERALARTPDGPVLAVGVTSMAETCALLGADGEPVAPAIAWHDLRGQDEAAALASGLGADRFAVRVGLPASALCTLAKYRWLRRHLPAALQGTRLLSVAEWVVHRLGGEQLAELSLASRTGALDRDAGDWWDEALAWAGGPAGLLPPVAPAGTPAGRAGRRRGRGRRCRTRGAVRLLRHGRSAGPRGATAGRGGPGAHCCRRSRDRRLARPARPPGAARRAARPCERSRPSGSASSNTRRWSKPARAVPPWWPAAPPVCTARWPPCPDPGASPHSTKGTLDDRATPRGARYREAVRARPRTTECRLRRLRRGGDRPDRRQRRG